jgi:eukaryotic-like serine/threonine-protein kinase
MIPEHWDEIKEKLNAVLSLKRHQRAAYIDEVAAANPELRHELESLLASHDQAGTDFLNTSAAQAVLEQASGAPALTIGKRIGAYQIVEQIGAGGMGEVYRAFRIDDEYQKQVAIKLVRAGQDSGFVLSRFKNERQIMASLDHPNIARLFDGGTTDEGVPYFVMELIEGEPIDEYCNHHKLSIAERLGLFSQVCSAVQYAHQRLIIHRDIKPGNILVTSEGVAKLLDFGIAKILDAEAVTGRFEPTLTMFRVMTPGYASPEQIKGEPITTASDVYSLGVVLYELLTACHPYRQADSTPQEVAHAACETEPEKPSAAVRRTETVQDSDTPGTGPATAAFGDSVEKLSKKLRGDLDNIILMALRKEPQRRYASAEQFAGDIRRHLNHEAVLAVPPSLGYWARKFARRYRGALAAACSLALVLIVAAVVIIRQGIRVNREAAVADAVNEFLQNDLLAQAGSSAQSGLNTNPDPHLEVRTALDRAAGRIEGKFAKQPDVEASIRDTIGWTYVDLGLYAEAQKQLERTLQLRQSMLGADDARTLSAAARLGRVAHLQGNYAEAEALETQALDAQRRVLGLEHPDTLKSMNNLANTYYEERKFALAEALYTQTLEIRKRVLGTEHPDTLQSMLDLALLYLNEEKYAPAEALAIQTLGVRKRVLGPEHPDTLGSMLILAWVYNNEEKYTESEALNTQVLEIRKRVLGPEHPETLSTMNNLAANYVAEGNYAKAEELFTQTWEIRKRVLGPEHPQTAGTLYNLGCMAALRGDKDRAILLLGQSVDHGLSPRLDARMEKDEDLSSLHGDPRFAALVSHAKQVAEAKQRAATPASQ